MNVRSLATLLIPAFGVMLPHVARADSPLLPVPILPSLKATTARTSAAPVALDHSFFGRAARLLDEVRPPASGGPRDASSRNPSLRDPARDRDATSFGIRSAPMSASGGAVAGVGIAAGAAQLIDFASVAKHLPVKVGPTMCQGGGGITIKLPW